MFGRQLLNFYTFFLCWTAEGSTYWTESIESVVMKTFPPQEVFLLAKPDCIFLVGILTKWLLLYLELQEQACQFVTSFEIFIEALSVHLDLDFFGQAVDTSLLVKLVF